MYAEYDPEKDKVEVSFQLSGNAYSSYYFCELTGDDAQLVKEKLTEAILERYDQTPQEFIKGDCDAGMTMGGI